jgi:hypothetical protein
MAIEVEETDEEDEEEVGKPKTQMEMMIKDNEKKIHA